MTASRSKSRRQAGGLMAFGLFVVAAAAPAAAGGRQFDLGVAGTLWLPVPSNWRIEAEPQEGPYPSWEIRPPAAGGALLLVTPTWGQLRHSAVDLRFDLAQE
ncbi:MAG: hypothetical protein JRI55_10705, partial [Deltaproteobacteria bacterium]|nr:hypothetical protein [Deltaproteobacteria bacterium]